MDEGRAIKQSDFFDLDATKDDKTWTLDGENFCTKKDVRGNVVYTEVGYGGKKRSKPWRKGGAQQQICPKGSNKGFRK